MKGFWKKQFSAVVSVPAWQHVRVLIVVTIPSRGAERAPT